MGSDKLEDWELKKFWEVFRGLNPVNNKLSNDKCANVFKNSQLPNDKLAKIWDLSDIDSDGFLDFEEFCIAMKLIFESVNGNLASIPDALPTWLVPGSKSHLIQANKALTGQLPNSSVSLDDDNYDEELNLSTNFDWYISPNDKSTYENIYNSSSDKFGRISFNSLTDLYNDLQNVPKTDIGYAWNLVNPKQYETIDKDQCMVFLHILNQRSSGKRVPRTVPASLRATFSKEVPQYNLNSSQTEVKNSSYSQVKDKSFGGNYLNKMGINKKNSSSSLYDDNGGIEDDYSTIRDPQWEEARLTKKLKEIEDRLERAEKEKTERKERSSKNSVIRYELEELLKYKESRLKQLEDEANGIGKSSGFDNEQYESISSDLNIIEEQVSVLEDYYRGKEFELEELKQQIYEVSNSGF
ncbi:End3p [Ascoidea rubescens DSM 1968]|uniref:Actin cytoskeleton-regulatory complex protein END3 n=1 Tax=Ascoidea rubescens DSM 1968 TaxID=1344418 RepID=A0A1D2VLS3_9ASCO|nr:EF-hand [Ascoidea rubescens DSM 1968]ODV62563.1 EF-hand [Ascoidea rubescens DSM 1968]